MKKTILLGAALILSAVTAFAQESRQDVSLSATGNFLPTVHGGTGVYTTSDDSLGSLLSYRYLLTPRSGLEANYLFTQNSPSYVYNGTFNYQIHTRQQEFSVEYVYNRTYKRYNPFVSGGVGSMFISPLVDYTTTTLDLKRTTTIGAAFGGGVAYELSPSFDIRAEYHGFLGKVPGFGAPGDQLKIDRYRVVSVPAIGIAYHF